MRLLIFNLATDADHPILGFTTRWICALAKRVEFIHVITMTAGRIEVPGNVRVHSVGKEKGYTEPRRAVEFYRILLEVLRRERIDACFSHMMPLFSVLAAPILRVKSIPVVTWYAHISLTWTLKVAHHLSDRMVASVVTAYPYKRNKLIATGQGIDTELFSPADTPSADDVPVILCSTRLSPVKDHSTLLKAILLLRQLWNKPFRVVIVGGPATPRDESYVRSLREQVKELRLEDTVRFEQPVSMKGLPFWYRSCTLHVNMTQTGSGDKVVWEAMSCGKLSVAANEGFRETFGKYADLLLFQHGNADQLARRIRWALCLNAGQRDDIGSYLREQVVKLHSLDRLMDKLIDLFSDCVEKRSPGRFYPKNKEAARRF